MTTIDDFLAHHGIKGMRWGVRRSRVELARGRGANASEDVLRVAAAKSKVGRRHDTSALSNKELQDLVTRMNLERQFKTLQGPSKSSKVAKAGTKVASDILLNAGKQIATQAVKGQLEKQLELALNKKK